MSKPRDVHRHTLQPNLYIYVHVFRASRVLIMDVTVQKRKIFLYNNDDETITYKYYIFLSLIIWELPKCCEKTKELRNEKV